MWVTVGSNGYGVSLNASCLCHGIYQGLRKEAWEIDASWQNSSSFSALFSLLQMHIHIVYATDRTLTPDKESIWLNICSCYLAAAPLTLYQPMTPAS